jgi:hypothetical protein
MPLFSAYISGIPNTTRAISPQTELRKESTMTRDMAKTGATFKNTYPRYPFAPLVALALMLARRIKAAGKPAGQSGARRGGGPVYQ